MIYGCFGNKSSRENRRSERRISNFKIFKYFKARNEYLFKSIMFIELHPRDIFSQIQRKKGKKINYFLLFLQAYGGVSYKNVADEEVPKNATLCSGENDYNLCF